MLLLSSQKHLSVEKQKLCQEFIRKNGWKKRQNKNAQVICCQGTNPKGLILFAFCKELWRFTALYLHVCGGEGALLVWPAVLSSYWSNCVVWIIGHGLSSVSSGTLPGKSRTWAATGTRPGRNEATGSSMQVDLLVVSQAPEKNVTCMMTKSYSDTLPSKWFWSCYLKVENVPLKSLF